MWESLNSPTTWVTGVYLSSSRVKEVPLSLEPFCQPQIFIFIFCWELNSGLLQTEKKQAEALTETPWHPRRFCTKIFSLWAQTKNPHSLGNLRPTNSGALRQSTALPTSTSFLLLCVISVRPTLLPPTTALHLYLSQTHSTVLPYADIHLGICILTQKTHFGYKR